jgi:hypothetical protein
MTFFNSRRLKNKDKIAPVLKQNTMKMYGRLEIELHIFLNSKEGSKWSACSPWWCSGYHAYHWTQGSRVHTQPRMMDI